MADSVIESPCLFGCVKTKEIIKLVGDVQMINLFKHVGNVLEGDSFDEALEKVRAGIKRQTKSRSKLTVVTGLGTMQIRLLEMLFCSRQTTRSL